MLDDQYLEHVLDIWATRGEKSSCTIIGNSMSPMIKDGDRLIIDHGTGRFGVGDIIVFKTGSQYVAHRIISVTRKGDKLVFLSKGDNCISFDQPVPRDQVIGKVVQITKATGHIHTDSYMWKTINSCLALLSYCSAKSITCDSPAWAFGHFLFRMKTKIVPRNSSVRQKIIDGEYRFSILVHKVKDIIRLK